MSVRPRAQGIDPRPVIAVKQGAQVMRREHEERVQQARQAITRNLFPAGLPGMRGIRDGSVTQLSPP